jgi:hypothetical protein
VAGGEKEGDQNSGQNLLGSEGHEGLLSVTEANEDRLGQVAHVSLEIPDLCPEGVHVPPEAHDQVLQLGPLPVLVLGVSLDHLLHSPEEALHDLGDLTPDLWREKGLELLDGLLSVTTEGHEETVPRRLT